MLAVCGNNHVLKPLIILENSFPLIGEGEASLLPEEILISKTPKGSMEKDLFYGWLQKAVVEHKLKVNQCCLS